MPNQNATIYQDIWDVYINSYICDSQLIWSGPNAGKLPLNSPIHVITACNPFNKLLTTEENSQRNILLHDELKTLNVKIKPVIGRSADGDWNEKSFAVYGLTRVQACDIACKYQQRGIFEMNENDLMVIDVNNQQVERSRPRNIDLT